MRKVHVTRVQLYRSLPKVKEAKARYILAAFEKCVVFRAAIIPITNRATSASNLLYGPSRGPLCLAKSPLSQAAKSCSLFLNQIKRTVSQVEEHGHAISIGFAGSSARESKLSRGASGHGHSPLLLAPTHSTSMDASLQHTKLGTLHEARHTAADSTRLGMGERASQRGDCSLYGRRTVGATGTKQRKSNYRAIGLSASVLRPAR